jgi:Na+-transporting NADH:ubiquinone oxidoreductase subunit C
MVVVVAAILSIAAMTLQPFQKKNVEINKKENILASINIESTAENAVELYDKYIVESYVVGHTGEVKEGVDAFEVDMKKEMAKPLEERNLPVFISLNDNEERQYILPVYGKGLWGPVWGYVSLQSNLSTIYGTNFSHEGETPGLGAEIATEDFQNQFIGKEIFNEKEGGTAKPDSKYEVDGISGGTITSKGVDEMLNDCLKSYIPYFENIKNQ